MSYTHAVLLSHLYPAARSLTAEAVKTLVQEAFMEAFISCRLDYCNSLIQGVSDGLV